MRVILANIISTQYEMCNQQVLVCSCQLTCAIFFPQIPHTKLVQLISRSPSSVAQYAQLMLYQFLVFLKCFYCATRMQSAYMP